MATVFEIVEKLRAGEEIVIHNKYRSVVMQQMTDHDVGDIRVNFTPLDKHHTKMTLAA